MQKFKVGDRVRVREWDDMAKEFGERPSGYIDTCAGFSRDMMYLCGQTGTVNEINTHAFPTWNGQKLWITWDEKKNDGRDRWNYDNGMFELIDNPKIVITTDGETTTAKLYDDKTPI